MKKQTYYLMLLAASFLLMLAGSAAQAATITVDESTCTLADAITAANTDSASGGCPAGSGADTITLETDVTLNTALPQIESAITIEGGDHFISGNHDTNVGSVLIVASDGDLILNEAIVKNGRNKGNGGGIYIDSSGIVTLNNSTVSENIVQNNASAYYYGGGIYNSGMLTLLNSTVSKNRVRDGSSGGIYNSGILTLINSTVSKNTAATYAASSTRSCSGGGIYNSGTLALTNSTVSGNYAEFGHGGGIYSSSTVTLANSTINKNSSRYGGGLASSGNIILRSSIVSGNTSSVGCEISAFSGIAVDSFNLFGHSSETSSQAFSGFIPGSSDINATSDGDTPTDLDAILSPLADNGGPTQTHALPEGSPAIDLDTDCVTELDTDQRGMLRPSGAACDAGAFELQSNYAPVADAGVDQTVVQGEEVCFDGSGSTDADDDELTYLWTLTAWPAGSSAELDNPTAVKSCLTADLPGTYQVSLIVNDGTEDSAPSTAEAVAISCQDVAREAVNAVNALDPSVFGNKNNQKNLTKGILEVIALVDQQLYAEALLKLEGGSVLGKTKGCATVGAPDNDDWIKDCASQATVYPLLQQTMVCVQRL